MWTRHWPPRAPEAQDWEGGTRIGACLEAFKPRLVAAGAGGRGAVVLLITDGLDRDEPARLAAAMERLHLSARRVIWVNPLLRWDGFAPKAAGIRAMLPHVDSFRAGHNIAALEGLAARPVAARGCGREGAAHADAVGGLTQRSGCAAFPSGRCAP